MKPLENLLANWTEVYYNLVDGDSFRATLISRPIRLAEGIPQIGGVPDDEVAGPLSSICPLKFDELGVSPIRRGGQDPMLLVEPTVS